MNELHWLAATCFMSALFWMVYVLNRMSVLGIFGAMKNPDPNNPPLAAWAQRAQAAHNNAIENLVLFAPLVLIVHALGISNAMSLLMVKLYFFARLAHFIVYTMGIPVVRTLSYAAGWIAIIVLAAMSLGLIS